MHEIAFSKQSLNQLRKIPTNESKRIRANIAEYAANPKAHAHHVKMLKGRNGFRLRVGKWRVIFDLNGNVLSVLEIGVRGNIYD